MILEKTHDTATLSNVGSVASFNIKATAKSFKILSDGLYSNKIKAIVRELSCNAYDSHVAAGRGDLPFDVHLPNSLEPWFVIRDYGVGLNDKEVESIFTVFFESTKTESNDFVGALGLGSKSPFSYTDSFTVTAIKDGIKRVYTAFINDIGVPSIALMGQDETTEPSGVEIRIAVDNEQDFCKFKREAEGVYSYFKVHPVISGNNNYEVKKLNLKTENIIPGVHHHSIGYHSIAIMGNIAYPIDNSHFSDEYYKALACSLVMEFDIGELDFQASREGLSYIPLTINAIKNKIDQLISQLENKLEEELSKIENKWEKFKFIEERYQERLWEEAVVSYVEKNNPDYITYGKDRWNKISVKEFVFAESFLKEEFNIVIKDVFLSYNGKCSNSSTKRRVDTLEVDDKGNKVIENEFVIRVNEDTVFVINDTKVGVSARARYHWRKNRLHKTVYVIEASDKKKIIKLKKFYNAILNPPENQCFNASTLEQKTRKAGNKKEAASIIRIEPTNRSRGWRNELVYTWQPAGELDTFDDNETYYYVGLKGFEYDSVCDPKDIYEILKNCNMFDNYIYGVRKKDMEQIAGKSNWVHIDTYVRKLLNDFVTGSNLLGIVKERIDFAGKFCYSIDGLNDNSPYKKIVLELKDVSTVKVDQSIYRLCSKYDIDDGKNKLEKVVSDYRKKVSEVFDRYPLLTELRWRAPTAAVVQYMNAIDQYIINNEEGK